MLLRGRAVPGGDPGGELNAWRKRLAAEGAEASEAMHACVDAVEQALRAASFDAGLAAAMHIYEQLASRAQAQHP